MNNTTRFSATIEYISGQSAAIVELTDSNGEWAGGGRIDVRPINGDVRAALYEAGYVHATARAASKGGALDKFSEWCSFCGDDFRRCVCRASVSA